MTKSGKPQDDLQKQLRQLVYIGLLEFWNITSGKDQKVSALFNQEIDRVFKDSSRSDWLSKQCEYSKALSNDHSSPMSRLIKYYDLSIAESFVFSLLGEIESSFVINLVIEQLQLPDTKTRPSLHILNALVEYLFDDEISDAMFSHFYSHPIVKDGLLILDEQGPLPLRKVKVQPNVWHSLISGNVDWPACTVLESEVNEPLLGERNLIEAKEISSLLVGDDISDIDTAFIIRGKPSSGRREFANCVVNQINRNAIEIPVELWDKHRALARICLFTGFIPVLCPNLGPGESISLQNVILPVFVLLGSEGTVNTDSVVETAMALPNHIERTKLWYSLVGDESLSNFFGISAHLSGKSINILAGRALRLAAKEQGSINIKHVKQARKYHGSEKLRMLAEPIDREVSKNDIVLPSSVEEQLDHLLKRSKKRENLCSTLGKTIRSTSNIGLRGLFVGESGTGKTLAASYIATQIATPLYRVDLASVMNKYIGESEKNLSQVLDEAAANDVVLLFDEADSLFGSRTEGKGTGERYANMLTNFLLTRIESHPGIILLTTNSKERIDSAFNRRIDIIAEFPLPGYLERLALWRSHLGSAGLNDHIISELANSCELAGGQIRNAVLTAAVYAENFQITEANLYQGLRTEYNKIGRAVPRKFSYLNSSQKNCA